MQMKSEFFSPLIETANELAAEWHAGTYRKGRWRLPAFNLPNGDPPRIPTISHVTMVALTVQRAGWDDVTVAAALLHDILEDPNHLGQIMTYDMLADLMGERVAKLVVEVTEEKLDTYGKRLSWKERKIGYIEGLMQYSAASAAISLSDKIHNMWSLNQSLEKGINVFESAGHRRGLNAGPEPQRWFYKEVYEATLHHNDGRLVPMRQRFLEELEKFQRLTDNFGFGT